MNIPLTKLSDNHSRNRTRSPIYAYFYEKLAYSRTLLVKCRACPIQRSKKRRLGFIKTKWVVWGKMDGAVCRKRINLELINQHSQCLGGLAEQFWLEKDSKVLTKFFTLPTLLQTSLFAIPFWKKGRNTQGYILTAHRMNNNFQSEPIFAEKPGKTVWLQRKWCMKRQSI